MKKAFAFAIFSTAMLFCIPLVSHAERIKSFKQDLVVNGDGSVRVTERITYDFEGASRHGIYRDIPFRNSDGSYLDILDVNAADDASATPTSVSQNPKNLRVRIGDPNVLVSGIRQYAISYTVKNSLVSFEKYDELYWNVTGSQWTVPIERASASVAFEGGSPKVVQFSCYRGPSGAASECSGVSADGAVRFPDTSLAPKEGMTIAVGFAKGFASGVSRIGGQTNAGEPPVSRYPSTERPSIFGDSEQWGIEAALCAAALALLAWFWSRNRDSRSQDPVVAWYEPPMGLPPISLGTLVDKDVDMRDIAAQILSLAQRGYLSISRITEKHLMVFSSTDYLVRVEKDPSGLTFAADTKVLNMLFLDGPESGSTVLMSDLKKSRYRVGEKAKEIRQDVADLLERDGYMDRKTYASFVPPVFGAGMIAAYAAVKAGALAGVGAVVLMAVLFLAFIASRSIKGKYTPSGADIRQKILGFRMFLSVTDKERFDFHNAPEKDPKQFMEYLPYAVALGVEEKWAEQFRDVLIPEPEWYRGSPGDGFVVAGFVSDLHSFSGSLAVAAVPAKSGSGGGGFSGGGGGGGGGGSW